MSSKDAIVIEKMVVEEGRLQCDVRVQNPDCLYTTEPLMQKIQIHFPRIPQHTCANKKGKTFCAVMDHTSLPHLMEHLVIELQMQHYEQSGEREAQSSCAVFVGATRWTDKNEGRARIEVSFTDDLVALRAFRDASNFLNETVLK